MFSAIRKLFAPKTVNNTGTITLNEYIAKLQKLAKQYGDNPITVQLTVKEDEDYSDTWIVYGVPDIWLRHKTQQLIIRPGDASKLSSELMEPLLEEGFGEEDDDYYKERFYSAYKKL
jgi:hypothetical protein